MTAKQGSDSGAFGNPVKGTIGPYGGPADPASGFVCTQGFNDEDTQYGPHDGLDIANGQSHDDIIAMRSGRVYQAFTDDASGGAKIVRIDHGDGWTTGYAHLASYSVSVGDQVDKGDKIGELDNTGWSTGAHLHMDTSYQSERRDPWPMLDQNQGDATAMVKYSADEFERIEPPGRYFLTLEGARFRRISEHPSTDDEILETFEAGQKVPAHARVAGENVNGSKWWLLAWMWADGATREGAFHRNSLDEGHDPE